MNKFYKIYVQKNKNLLSLIHKIIVEQILLGKFEDLKMNISKVCLIKILLENLEKKKNHLLLNVLINNLIILILHV